LSWCRKWQGLGSATLIPTDKPAAHRYQRSRRGSATMDRYGNVTQTVHPPSPQRNKGVTHARQRRPRGVEDASTWRPILFQPQAGETSGRPKRLHAEQGEWRCGAAVQIRPMATPYLSASVPNLLTRPSRRIRSVFHRRQGSCGWRRPVNNPTRRAQVPGTPSGPAAAPGPGSGRGGAGWQRAETKPSNRGQGT